MFSILTYGLSVAVVGMATVFCGLIILIGFIKGMEKVLPKIAARDFSFKKAFVVRSIRRVGIPAWNRAGREEQIYSRL